MNFSGIMCPKSSCEGHWILSKWLRYLYYPPYLAFECYCDYNALKPIYAAHCFLPTNNKEEKISDQDSAGDYDINNGGDGGR